LTGTAFWVAFGICFSALLLLTLTFDWLSGGGGAWHLFFSTLTVDFDY
jgi:hypothetical protein